MDQNAISWKEKEIGPDEARRILSTRGLNRRVRPGIVRGYARAMKEGRWRLTHQGLAFDEHGQLLDGQHRLHAVIESGQTVRFMVATGVPRACFPELDNVSRRTGSDALQIEGHPRAAQLSSTLRWIYRLERGSMVGNEDSRTPDNHELLDVLSRHPRAASSVEKIAEMASGYRLPLPVNILAFIHYVGYVLSTSSEIKSRASVFAFGVITGVGLEVRGDPRLALRDRMQANAASRGKLPTIDKMAMAVKAWNAFVDCRELKSVTWRRTGKNPERFPSIRGAESLDASVADA